MVKLIADAIKQAQRVHREALEATYMDTSTIYEKRPYKDPVTKVTVSREAVVWENQPCHLSFSSSPVAAPSKTVSVVAQEIKLFLAPEIIIPPGSRITVTHQGRTEDYGQSGKPAVYLSHQEILLELWMGYT